MKILMTGTHGFLGSNLCACLARGGGGRFEIIPLAVCRDDAHGATYNSAVTTSGEGRGDVSIDVLLHVGAFTPKAASEMNDAARNASNIFATQSLLRWLPVVPHRIIYVSTVSVYRAGLPIPISEETEVSPDSLYGMSKLFCERLIQDYARLHGIDCLVLRMGTIYGNNFASNGLVPTVIRRVLQGEGVPVYNGGKALRSFIHVNDCCRAIQNALAGPVKYPVVNVASSESLSVNELVRKIALISGRRVSVEQVETGCKLLDVRYDNHRMIECFGPNETGYDAGLSEAFRFFEARAADGDL